MVTQQECDMEEETSVDSSHHTPISVMMMMMFIGTETLVTQLVREISRMQAC